ncbi:MAG: hypothetical protein HY647_07340 [Acidobacteria bacterium]|nr:hypothetical protein [Acidobacteriota bacterium]
MPGLLGYLTFRLNDDARPANITLSVSAQATDLANKPVQDLRAFEAKVDVVEAGSMPVVACFFFTH